MKLFCTIKLNDLLLVVVHRIHISLQSFLISKQNIIKSAKVQLKYTESIQKKHLARKREVKKIMKTKHIKI